MARNIVHGLAFQQGQLSNSASRCLFLTISPPRRVGAALSHSPTTRVWRRHLSHVAGNVRPVLGLSPPCLSHVLPILASPGSKGAFLTTACRSFLTDSSLTKSPLTRAATLKHTLSVATAPTPTTGVTSYKVFSDRCAETASMPCLSRPSILPLSSSHASASTVRRVSSPTTTFP